MSRDEPDEPDRGGRAFRWALIGVGTIVALVTLALLGGPSTVRRQLGDDYAKTCERIRAFERPRPTAEPGGPPDATACLDAVVEALDPSRRAQLAAAWSEQTRLLHEPIDVLWGPEAEALDGLTERELDALRGCDGAASTRWKGVSEPVLWMLVELRLRDADAERDADERLRRLVKGLAQVADLFSAYDDSIISLGLWAGYIGAAGRAASPAARAEAVETMRALAASLPDIEATTAMMLCAHLVEIAGIEDWSLEDTWEMRRQYGGALARGAELDPQVWGPEPGRETIERAIPSGSAIQANVNPSSSYAAALLHVSAAILAPRAPEARPSLFGAEVEPVSLPPVPPAAEPCFEVAMPAALAGSPIERCGLHPVAVRAARELRRLFHALRRGDGLPELTGSTGGEIADGTIPCAEIDRTEAERALWRRLGYDAPARRRIRLEILGREDPEAPELRSLPPEADTLLLARWRDECEGPLRAVAIPVWTAEGEAPSDLLMAGEIAARFEAP